MSETETELKPCPFCDKPAVLGIEDSTHLVVCPWCWARVASHTEQGAIDRWNGRPAEVAYMQARAEGEVAGYRRAINEACAAIDALYAGEGVRTSEGEYTRGTLDGFEAAEDVVRALAPAEPVSPTDGLPRGA